jgi:hypothetical protein
MPFEGVDPWRWQYFAARVPERVIVPIDDAAAYRLHPKERWVYNKLLIAESQGLCAGPHGMTPPGFPVFSKPIMNMRGMGTGGRVLRGPRDYVGHQQPGHFWMPLLTGAHASTDVAVERGRPVWWRTTIGHPRRGGTFDYWHVLARRETALERRCRAWIGRHLPEYTGVMNFETIGGRIIEVHLRFADQWPDLYGGDPWVRALVRLYEHGRWEFEDSRRHAGYSVVLFLPHGPRYRHPPEALQKDVRAMAGVSSLQITFHPERDPAGHAMPPGGFRVAIVNCWDRAAGNAARQRLRDQFGMR